MAEFFTHSFVNCLSKSLSYPFKTSKNFSLFSSLVAPLKVRSMPKEGILNIKVGEFYSKITFTGTERKSNFASTAEFSVYKGNVFLIFSNSY